MILKSKRPTVGWAVLSAKGIHKIKKMWQPNQIYGKGDFPHSLGRGIWIIGGWEKGANLMNGPRDRVGLEMGREPSAPYTKKQS